MKKVFLILPILSVSLLFAACAKEEKTETKIKKKNAIETVIDEQVAKLEEKEKEEEVVKEIPKESLQSVTGESEIPTEGGNFAEQFGKSEFDEMLEEAKKLKKNGDIDYDLTEMNSDMVYATVFLMMSNPDSYQGKKFRMRGNYYAAYYEPTKKTYHYCFISDAAGCCEQGLEFATRENLNYPDDFPEDNTEVLVTGVFEKYTEEGKIFIRLKDADMLVLGEEDKK